MTGPHLRVHADLGEIVAVEGDIQFAQRFLDIEAGMKLFGNPGAATVYANHDRIINRALGNFPPQAILQMIEQGIRTRKFNHSVAPPQGPCD